VTTSPSYRMILASFSKTTSESGWSARFFGVSQAKSPFPPPGMLEGAILSFACAARCCQQYSVPMHTVLVQREPSTLVPRHVEQISGQVNLREPTGASNL
jgi:hypothetical protein